MYIGTKTGTSIALRNISYDVLYQELESHDSYHVKLIDGALLLFQYHFDQNHKLVQHRLGYFPSPVLPTPDEAPDLYNKEELFGDIIVKRLVRFPIRFDCAPNLKREIFHPALHLTLGQYENCRIPVCGPVTPMSFAIFIVRNFYFSIYKKFKNLFDKRGINISSLETICSSEKRITHLMNGP